MNLNIIFTWWHNQTFGTFLKTLFYGAYVGKDEFGNKYYQSKKNERWVIYSKNIEATKITSDWYLWIHHTVDKIPKENFVNNNNKIKNKLFCFPSFIFFLNIIFFYFNRLKTIF